MLTVRRILDVADNSVIYLVCSGRNVLEQSASSADSIKVSELVSLLLDSLQDGFLSERSLIYDMRILSDLSSIMIDAYTHDLILIFKNADLGRSSARVDNKNLLHEIITPFGLHLYFD